MPFNIIATEGVLSDEVQASTHKAVTDCFLKLHKLTGNSFLELHVIGEVSIVPKGKSFAGGRPENFVIVEVKLPSFAFGTAEQKQAYAEEVTEIIHQASGGKQDRNRIYVNLTFAVDGLWSIAGKAYTNAELGEAINEAAAK